MFVCSFRVDLGVTCSQTALSTLATRFQRFDREGRSHRIRGIQRGHHWAARSKEVFNLCALRVALNDRLKTRFSPLCSHGLTTASHM